METMWQCGNDNVAADWSFRMGGNWGAFDISGAFEAKLFLQTKALLLRQVTVPIQVACLNLGRFCQLGEACVGRSQLRATYGCNGSAFGIQRFEQTVGQPCC